jgi:hypothetical protein
MTFAALHACQRTLHFSSMVLMFIADYCLFSVEGIFQALDSRLYLLPLSGRESTAVILKILNRLQYPDL